jgi:predicted nucleotidyltransferase
VRLKPHESEAIRASVAEVFGTETPVWLFGSRVEDGLRGGDIDLYVETSLSAEDRLRRRFRLLALLLERLGEQKIDLVLADPGNPEEQNRLVVREAKAKGLRL